MQQDDFQQRTALVAVLQQYVGTLSGTQATKAKALGITQPRLSDLVRNRADKFSLNALVALAKRAGLQLNVNAQLVPFQRARLSLSPARRAGSPFPMDPRVLGQFDTAEASRLLLRLLRCEVLAAGLSPKNVTLSGSITTPDGGIDAKVVGIPKRDGVLREGSTHYQVKTGSAFKPWQAAQIRKEIFGKARPSKKALGSAVRECLDNDGHYCLITFGHDLLPQQHSDSERHLIELFRACGYPNPRVMVLGQGHIAGEIEEFPSIYCELFGFEQDNFLAYRQWSESPPMTLPLEIGPKQREVIDSIREVLLRDAPSHIRLVGEPGIGKTRLVLEALAVDDMAPSVIYVPTGEDFQKSHLFRTILRSSHPFFLVLVIDDCDDNDRASILAALQSNRNVRLVTIDHGYARGIDSTVTVIECPPLAEESILAILQGYVKAPDYDLKKWAELCQGSPRVAHAVGENLKNNPNDVLKPPASVPVWERFISGFAKTDSIEARERKLVLRYIALFTRFGFNHPVSDEAKFIAEEVRKAEPSITWARFQAIVKHFQDRRVLQGRHTLFLVPKALHLHLWVEFWNQHGRDFDFTDFLQRMPSSMRDWFLRLFTYAHQAEPALAVVRQLLGPQGALSSPRAVASSVTPRLVRYLAEADSSATLSYIERIYGQWHHEDLLAWKDGRQDIVWALECIAVWAECFDKAAHVLAKMAVAENSNNSNNSRGTLVGLFSIGLGWAATQATPAQRFPTLKMLVTSRDDAFHALGLELAESWLSTHGGSRIIGPEHQGLRPTIAFWRPKTYGEVFEAWRQVWRLLVDEYQGAPASRRDGIAKTLISAAPGLVTIAALSQEVIDTLFSLAGAVDNKKPLVGLVIELLRNRNEQLPKEIMARVEELDRLLTGTTLWDRISRFVLHTNWSEDHEFSGSSVQRSTKPDERVQEVATELMSSKQSLEEYAERLLRASGHRLPQLGALCGRQAIDATWDDVLRRQMIEMGQGIGAEFLAGYLAGVRVNDKSRWEAFLLSMLESEQFRAVAIECAWRSGVSNRVLDRMVELFGSGLIEARSFNRFAVRSAADCVSEASINAVVDALLASSDGKASAIAAELLYDYYVSQGSAGEQQKAIPRDRPLRVLLASAKTIGDREAMRDFYWGRLAKHFIQDHPDDAIAVFETVLASGDLLGFTNSEVSKVLLEILRTKPDEAWRAIAAVLDSDRVSSFRLASWLTGEAFEERRTGPSPAAFIPSDALIAWIKEEPEKRSLRALELLPRTLDPAMGGAMTERYIEEFAKEERVAGGLAAHFWSGGWSGPRSAHLERKRDAARRWLSAATTPNVQSWLSEYIASLSADIESAKIEEEREF
jgi:predicted XRE-type DNA-binding protein